MKTIKLILIIQMWLVVIIGVISYFIGISIEAKLINKLPMFPWITIIFSAIGSITVIMGALMGFGKLTIKILELGDEKQN